MLQDELTRSAEPETLAVEASLTARFCWNIHKTQQCMGSPPGISLKEGTPDKIKHP